MPLCVATTAAGKPCKRQAIGGSELCVSHAGLAGRVPSLDAALTERLATTLRAGNYLGVALRSVGVARGTFNGWMARGRSQAAEDAMYRELREKVEQARAQGEVRNVAEVSRAATTDWKAAAWLLERQFPARWGKTSVHARDAAPAEPAVGAEAADDPFREVDELAERRRARS